MDKWEKLYHAVNRMMAVMGAEGEVNTQMAVADDVMGALYEIDGGGYNEALTITAPCGLNQSEAVYGFASWLTSREEVTKMSATDDCGEIAALVELFCKENHLPEVSDEWPRHLIHPQGEVALSISDEGYGSDTMTNRTTEEYWDDTPLVPIASNRLQGIIWENMGYPQWFWRQMQHDFRVNGFYGVE